MSLSADVDTLLLAIFEREQERERKGEPEPYFESADLAAALGWTPDRFNRAVELLEKRGLVEVDPTLGSAPYVTRALLLTAEGLLAGEKLGERPQPAQPASTMPALSMARDPAEQHALDVVADYLEGTAVLIDGRALRSKMKGSVEENNSIIAKLVPALLLRDGEYPSDRYRLTLEGALESSHGHVIRQYLGDVLDVLKAKAKRNKTFEEFSLDDIKAGDSDIAEAFDEKSFKWLHRVMRIAGIVKESSPDGGPWGVPDDIEEVLECKNVEELRRLRRGDLYDPTGRVMDPKTFGLEDVHIALLDRIAEYELEHAELTPINHALLAEPPERENDVRDRLDVLSAKDCIEITGFSGPELLPLRPWACSRPSAPLGPTP